MGNPAGFKTDKAMSFGVVNVKIDTDSSTKDVIVIKEVVIDSPDINYEKINGKANFDVNSAECRRVREVEMGWAGGKKEVQGSEKGGTEADHRDHLYVRDGKGGRLKRCPVAVRKSGSSATHDPSERYR